MFIVKRCGGDAKLSVWYSVDRILQSHVRVVCGIFIGHLTKMVVDKRGHESNKIFSNFLIFPIISIFCHRNEKNGKNDTIFKRCRFSGHPVLSVCECVYFNIFISSCVFFGISHENFQNKHCESRINAHTHTHIDMTKL